MKTRLLLLTLGCLACACGHARPKTLLARGAEGWAVEGKPWTIEPLANGAAMPDGWESAAPDETELAHFTRVKLDGFLDIYTNDIAPDDRRKALRTFAERQMNNVRYSAGQYSVGLNQPMTPLKLKGAEGWEATFERRRPNDYSPVSRTYVAWIRPSGTDHLVTVWFYSPTGQFDEGLEAVKGLVQRLRFIASK